VKQTTETTLRDVFTQQMHHVEIHSCVSKGVAQGLQTPPGTPNRALQALRSHSGPPDTSRHPISCLEALRKVLLDKVWESSTNVGMMRVGFCPEQTKRRSTFVTTYWSRFTNLHTEEVISRLANREFDLWFTEVEYLCLLIDELTRGATLPTMASYMRLHLRDSSMLIKLLRIHTRDHLNRVIQAQVICEPVTIEEWDEAAQKTPHIVRPYMMAAGDKRNGAALLADMEADMERMRIVNLTRTAEGSAFLRRLLRYA